MENARTKLFAVGGVIEQYDQVAQAIQAERLKLEQLRRVPSLSDKVTPDQLRDGIERMENQLALVGDILLYYTGAETVEEARDRYAALVTSYNYWNKCRDAVALVRAGADAAEELGLPEVRPASLGEPGLTAEGQVSEKLATAHAAVLAAADQIALPALSTLLLA